MTRQKKFGRSAAVLAGALLWTVVGAVSAQAAPQVQIEYDLGDSSGTNTVTLPVFGSVSFDLGSESFDGSQTIRYTSDSASNPVNGPVSLVSFNLTVVAPISVATFTPNGGTTPIKISTSTIRLSILNLPQGGGTLSGSAINPQGLSATFRVTGTAHCYEACFAAGIPKSSPVPIQTTTFQQALPTLYTSGNGATVTGTATSSFTLDPGAPSTATAELIPVMAQTAFVGREVSRTPIPEPGTLMLFGAGLAGLAAVGSTGEAARRIRRRRRG